MADDNVTSCPRSPESKLLSQPPPARERPPESQTPASRRARSLRRPQLARASSPLPSHGARSAAPSLSLPPRYAPASNDRPRASCGSALPSACAPDPATAHAHLPERWPHPPRGLRYTRPVQEFSPRPARLKRTHNRALVDAPFPAGYRKASVPTEGPNGHVEESLVAAPFSCPPDRAPIPAPLQSAGTRYLNREHSLAAIRAAGGAAPPAEAPAAVPRVETQLAASHHRSPHRREPPRESPDARAANAPLRRACFPPAHPCARSRPLH